MTSVWHDLRYGLQMLGKNPGLTVISILTLGLGIGAATVICSVVDSVRRTHSRTKTLID